jgi:hydrogenase expression/formation protein HypC
MRNRRIRMCLAVPMEITEIIGEHQALVQQGRTKLEINTSLLKDPKVGDFVIVHAGFGIEILDVTEARERLDLFRQIEETQ